MSISEDGLSLVRSREGGSVRFVKAGAGAVTVDLPCDLSVFNGICRVMVKAGYELAQGSRSPFSEPKMEEQQGRRDK